MSQKLPAERCVKGLREQSPSGSTCLFFGSRKWDMAACVWEGCVCAAACRFVVGTHHHITAHSSSVILVTCICCFTCCVGAVGTVGKISVGACQKGKFFKDEDVALQPGLQFT